MTRPVHRKSSSKIRNIAYIEIMASGTLLHGGRFMPVGVRAVYGSIDEETAFREVTTRKRALGGRSQIALADYPRMTYVLSIATVRNIDLSATLPSELSRAIRLCLRGPGYSASQELAAIWISKGIESVVFDFCDRRRTKHCRVSSERRGS
jgi:hypothetical protein